MIALSRKALVLQAGFSDAAYEEAGVKVVGTAKAVWEGADVIVKVLGPDKTELKYLNTSKTLISFFWPAQNSELLDAVNKTGATVLAMDMVPRISRAQKMDALSSMANIAGYRAVIEAGNNFGRFLLARSPRLARFRPQRFWLLVQALPVWRPLAQPSH